MGKTAVEKLTECPKCGGESLRTVWCNGRKLKQECTSGFAGHYGDYCGWEGEPFTPKKQPILTTRTIDTDGGGWTYEAYDQFGHVYCSSQSYSRRGECEAAALKDIENTEKRLPAYGKCTAIIWPPTVKLHGIRITTKKRK